MSETVYLENTFISYLASWMSGDLVRAAQQRVTRQWWEDHRHKYDLFVSELVVLEASAGDPAAAKARLELIKSVPLLPITAQAKAIAEALLEQHAVPKTEPRDALHIGICAANQMDYLLTWNFKHLANAHMVRKIESVVEATHHRSPIICTPEFLME
jgi:hypothetical protein